MRSTKSTMVAGAAASLLAAAAARADGVGTVALEVTALRPAGGEVVAALFRSPEGFPDGRQAFRVARIPATGRTAVATFPGLPAGDYAIAVFHDEDRDGKLDTGLLGIPLEGYGASRNDLPRFSAPTWKGNRFPLSAGETRPIQIRVRY